MSSGKPSKSAGDLEAEPLVEPGSLEREGVEVEEGAPPYPSFRLDHAHQFRPDTAATLHVVDP